MNETKRAHGTSGKSRKTLRVQIQPRIKNCAAGLPPRMPAKRWKPIGSHSSDSRTMWSMELCRKTFERREICRRCIPKTYGTAGILHGRTKHFSVGRMAFQKVKGLERTPDPASPCQL
jgi:hypothetical protein